MNVTDHALLRWLQRVHGIDIEWYRQALALQLDDIYVPGMRAISDGGVRYCFVEGRLATIYLSDERENVA